MSFREGRGRPHRDYPSRSEDRSYHGRGSNPPSRHLWVGNLPHNLTESDVAHHFLHFGELESIAFQPGRSYAFINYINEEDAYAAFKELQGFGIEGNPLRIEYAKAEKSLVPPRDADYPEREQRDNSHPRGRGSPFSSRDARMRYSSPESLHHRKSKTNDKNAEPSEVLWIGFPAQLKVDEFVLRKAFSRFGDIEKITAFPGRTYAFVRFRDVMAACNAKETLQGKLFGNPRVHICFAKNEMGPSNRERNSNAPPSPHIVKYGRTEYFDYFPSDREYGHKSGDPSIRSPSVSHMDRRDRNIRNNNSWSGRNDIHDRRRFSGQGSELGLSPDIYDHPHSPSRNMRVRIREFSPEGYPHQGPMYDDPWDLPEDVSLLHGTKKPKTITFPTDNELPDFPLSDLEKSKRMPSRNIPQSGLLDNDDNSRHSGYRPIPEHLMNTGQPFMERGDHWNAPYDDFQVAPTPMPPLDRRKLTPDSRGSSSKEVWRWEGMIAKGGTMVCRARCFPVGKPPDMVLPEILDCTARTSLDMLAKHYYQAASASAVFFAPANDPDISYYNEFMSYLGEKQRAAVVKLDERNTLFLIPPSEFSEKVLKVPGKVSISGVVLRIDPSGSSYGSLPPNENRETSFNSFQNDSVYQNQVSPSLPYLPPPPPLTGYEKPGTVALIPGNSSSISDMRSSDAHGHDYDRNSNSSIRDITPQASNPPMSSMGHPYYSVPRQMQEATHSSYTPGNSGLPSGNGKWPIQENPSIPSPSPVAGLPPELAQLASSLLSQQGHSSSGEYKPSGGNLNQPGYLHRMPQNYGLPNDQMSSDFPPSQYNNQVRQLQQQSPNLVASQREAQLTHQQQQQLQNAEQDDPDADPQKRLEATLHLAAALLQQIQQGKGT
ncbi:flowering time control protein FPA isoform X1 [Salvia hispanica]|uniref:flowering time control protein FPA isoform X1 n=1 Tax=Salvia hispanica TaxID=49212 RepID=UPI002009AE23|nr:flowering time control protein FPA isoform X1 [Salvia hispanica]